MTYEVYEDGVKLEMQTYHFSKATSWESNSCGMSDFPAGHTGDVAQACTATKGALALLSANPKTLATFTLVAEH